MLDAQGRRIHYLRLSITDRCNLRCLYCMPEDGVPVFRHDAVLRYEEYLRLVRLLVPLGIDSVRVTGGEPTVRRGYLDLIRELHAIAGIRRIAMTSNGVNFAENAVQAKAAGLDAINISLDTLDSGDYRRITRVGNLQDPLRSIDASLAAGLQVKINAVPVRDLNPQGLLDLAALAREREICVRFIELMPVGFGDMLKPLPQAELQTMLEQAFGPMEPDLTVRGDGPAVYLRPRGFRGSLGFIAAVSHAFCDSCNRIRITADGQLKLCLNHRSDLDLRALIRGGASDAVLADALQAAISRKPREHNFEKTISDKEQRTMSAIGG